MLDVLGSLDPSRFGSGLCTEIGRGRKRFPPAYHSLQQSNLPISACLASDFHQQKMHIRFFPLAPPSWVAGAAERPIKELSSPWRFRTFVCRSTARLNATNRNVGTRKSARGRPRRTARGAQDPIDASPAPMNSCIRISHNHLRATRAVTHRRPKLADSWQRQSGWGPRCADSGPSLVEFGPSVECGPTSARDFSQAWATLGGKTVARSTKRCELTTTGSCKVFEVCPVRVHQKRPSSIWLRHFRPASLTERGARRFAPKWALKTRA